MSKLDEAFAELDILKAELKTSRPEDGVEADIRRQEQFIAKLEEQEAP